MFQYALGLIETRGLIGAIEATDAALKTSHVQLIGHERIDAGLITVKILGETAAVQAAVDAAAAAAQRVSELISVHVIPRPHEEIEQLLESRRQHVTENEGHLSPLNSKSFREAIGGKDASEYRGELNKLTVHELRSLARSVENLSIHGRQISMANKNKLIEELIRARFG